jgi:hypothetical protein
MESYEAQVCKQEEFYSHFEHRLAAGFATKQMGGGDRILLFQLMI